jgi:4-amino-4-deoxy-L-arabinose transferase-like glycosyltransferase
VLLPALVAAAGLLGVLLSSDPSDRELIIVVPALVLMAAFGVSTLRRAADNAIDWFSIVIFVLVLIGAWAYFIAWNAGVPPKMAASVTRIVPGLSPGVDPVAAIVAIAATAAWVALAVWRVRVRPPMLWRGPALAAAGLTAIWVLVATLYARPIEFNRGLRPTAIVLGDQVRRLAGPDACVQAYQLPTGMRAMLAYHGAIRFSGHGDDSDACRIVIQRDSQRTQLDDPPPIGDWQLAYETTRRARYDEVFRIWVRRH